MFKRLFLALATLTITVSASAQASPILLTFDTSGVATDAHLLAGGVGSVDYTFFTDSKNVTLDIAGVNPPSPYFGTDLISGWISTC